MNSQPKEKNYHVSEGNGLYLEIDRFLKSDGTPRDVSEWSFFVRIKRRRSDETSLLECSVENGRLSLDELNSEIKFSLTPEDVKIISPGKSVYDLRVDVPSEENSRFPVEGEIIIQDRISKKEV
jgi:hypothetical protein